MSEIKITITITHSVKMRTGPNEPLPLIFIDSNSQNARISFLCIDYNEIFAESARMPFLKAVNSEFFIKEGRIVLSPDFLSSQRPRFKKITGSRFGSILGRSDFNSPAKVWAIMSGIYQDKVDEFFTRPGIVIEPHIKKVVEERLRINFKSYNPASVKWDIFKESPIFGGIPDGEPIDDSGHLHYNTGLPMLEIKTSSQDKFVYKKSGNEFVLQKTPIGLPIIKEPFGGIKKWFPIADRVLISDEYKYQLGLYMYLRGTKYGVFAVGFLKDTDYLNPEEFINSERDIRLINFELDSGKFQHAIKYAEQWYNTYIVGGFSPPLSENDHATWLSEILTR